MENNKKKGKKKIEQNKVHLPTPTPKIEPVKKQEPIFKQDKPVTMTNIQQVEELIKQIDCKIKHQRNQHLLFPDLPKEQQTAIIEDISESSMSVITLLNSLVQLLIVKGMITPVEISILHELNKLKIDKAWQEDKHNPEDHFKGTI